MTAKREAAPPVRVLAVDPEAGSLAAIREALAGPTCEVVAASSGSEALRQVMKNDFVLILLAVDLHRLDGLEVATLIRQVKRSSQIPIIFLTSPGGAARPSFKGEESGFVDYIPKPPDPAVLQSAVAAFASACGRNREMGRVGAHLESIIRERTSSLIRANDELRREVERRERAEAALQAARLEAETANVAKSEFLANMSHEIRTPLNGIVGLIELAMQTQLSAEQREYLNLVNASAGALLAIINDILDFSKIEAGSLDVERTAFSLRETLGDAMKVLAFEAGRKGLELGCEIEPDLPDALLGDPVRLRQIVTNLVGNAIKFTASGEVALRVRRRAAGDGTAVCEFTVSDTGIGIPGEKLKAIFAPFFQADTSTTRMYGGTGLGLTIAARLVEIMGGTIAVDSEPGMGSRFRFTLGFGVPEGEHDQPRPDFSGLRVLAAAPRISGAALAGDLRHWGADVVEAVDGAAALVALEAAAAGVPFDLALLDDGLTGIDACETAARICRGEHRGARIAAVLGSIAARQSRSQDGLAGAFALLTKPVKQSELLLLANQAAGRADHGAPVQAQAETLPLPDAVSPLDVLLVEDNVLNGFLAQQVLSNAGHRVTTADGGAAALELLAARRYDVVLMDVQMPGMDGIEATRLLRERERTAGGHVPVIALTAHAMVQHRERCLKAGMDGFLVKPIRARDLLEALAGIERAARRAEPQRSRRSVDRVALLERVDGDPVLLAEVARMLGDKGARLMAETGAALAARDAAQCARLLHTLGGMFSNLAAEAAAEMAVRLEGLTASSQWGAADGEFARLEWELERVAADLAALALADDAAQALPDGIDV